MRFLIFFGVFLLGFLFENLGYSEISAHSEQYNIYRRASSYPYISWETFRSIADFVLDYKYPDLNNEIENDFDPVCVKKGDVIFVHTLRVDDFFDKFHDKIVNKYLLITGGDDNPLPGSHAKYLNDPKIYAWFTQNIDRPLTKKLISIPLGIAPTFVKHGNIDVVTNILSLSRFNRFFCYVNFSDETYPTERGFVKQLFLNEKFCFFAQNKSYENYLRDLCQSLFVLSPRGNGLDCHRTWEGILCGAIPVVKTSTLDPLFLDLPVLIINDWTEITRDFLRESYKNIKYRKFCLEKAKADYWLNLIRSYQKELLDEKS